MSENVLVVGWPVHQFEDMARNKIYAKLRMDRKDMLKHFKCGSIMAENVQEAIELRDMIDKCYVVEGWLALDDSGEARAFKFLIEKALPWKDAIDVAEQLASQIDKCADRMVSMKKRFGTVHG